MPLFLIIKSSYSVAGLLYFKALLIEYQIFYNDL